MASVVKISITEEVARALEHVKHRYPTLSDSELFRLGLAELSFKAEQEERQAWMNSLPSMELSSEAQESLSEGIKSLTQEKKAGTLKSMTFEAFKAHAKNVAEEDDEA